MQCSDNLLANSGSHHWHSARTPLPAFWYTGYRNSPHPGDSASSSTQQSLPASSLLSFPSHHHCWQPDLASIESWTSEAAPMQPLTKPYPNAVNCLQCSEMYNITFCFWNTRWSVMYATVFPHCSTTVSYINLNPTDLNRSSSNVQILHLLILICQFVLRK